MSSAGQIVRSSSLDTEFMPSLNEVDAAALPNIDMAAEDRKIAAEGAQILQLDQHVSSTSTSRKVYVWVSIALFYVLSFTLLTSVLHRRHGFPLDDSYIHQTVARNFATSGRLGFIAGRRSSGSTSLLWEFVQAGNYRFLGGIDPVWYTLVISYLLPA